MYPAVTPGREPGGVRANRTRGIWSRSSVDRAGGYEPSGRGCDSLRDHLGWRGEAEITGGYGPPVPGAIPGASICLCGKASMSAWLRTRSPECNSRRRHHHHAPVADVAHAPGSNPGEGSASLPWSNKEKNVPEDGLPRKWTCPTCGGSVSDLPQSIATHAKRCRRARGYQRDHFREHGSWPHRGRERGFFPIQTRCDSHQRANFNSKILMN